MSPRKDYIPHILDSVSLAQRQRPRPGHQSHRQICAPGSGLLGKEDYQVDEPLVQCLGFKGCKTEATGEYSRCLSSSFISSLVCRKAMLKRGLVEEALVPYDQFTFKVKQKSLEKQYLA